MCWVIDDRKKFATDGNGKLIGTKIPDQKIACDDIVVFKVLCKYNYNAKAVYNKYTSAVMNYPYTIGKTYFEKIHPQCTPWNEWIIEKGLHCYSKNVTFSYRKQPYSTLRRMSMIVDTGHGIVTYDDDLMGLYKEVVVKCIIPKGSTYYENYRNEIVTEKIIILKEIPSELIRNKIVKGENLCAG